jgi:hypothetical protein
MNSKRKPLAAFGLFFFFVAPTLAQFEIAPDHLDGPASEARPQAAIRQQEIQFEITQHQNRLEGFRAQIRKKYLELHGILKHLAANGTEAEQELAIATKQKELERLETRLASDIINEERTIRTLRTELAALEQPALNRKPHTKRLAGTHTARPQVVLVHNATTQKDSLESSQ